MIMKKTKFITCIYDNLFGTELGGRINRGGHYRFSLLSILKITDADFVCYTSEKEIESLKEFFYGEHNVNPSKLELKVYDIKNCYTSELINKYKDLESTKHSDRCIEIQYMKFFWFLLEDMSYENYYWIDAGLSYCGLIPNKYLSMEGSHNRGYYESTLFNNNMLKNLIKKTKGKFIVIGKENQRNYWSGTVNPKHYINHDASKHIIGGLFGGTKENFEKMVNIFREYVYNITKEDEKLYHEENIMSVIYRNFQNEIEILDFDTWWHENERISGLDMESHLKENKSFYKILEELNEL
jgi:hypothetical protein